MLTLACQPLVHLAGVVVPRDLLPARRADHLAFGAWCRADRDHRWPLRWHRAGHGAANISATSTMDAATTSSTTTVTVTGFSRRCARGAGGVAAGSSSVGPSLIEG